MDAVQQGTRRHRRLRRLVPGLPARLVPGLLRPGQLPVPVLPRWQLRSTNGYSNKEVNDLIVKQAGEKDATKREEILKQVQALETEDLSTIPLLQGAQVAVTGTNIKGVVLDASFRFRYASVTKS